MPLLRCQGRGPRVNLLGFHQAVHDAGGNAFLEEGLARCCPPQRADQVRAADLLQHISAGPGQDGAAQGLFVIEARQDDAVQGRVHRPHVPADLDAGAVRQAGVQHADIRVQGGNPPGRLHRGTGTADHHEALALEEFLQPAPDEFVVIKDKDADHRLRAIRCSETCVCPGESWCSCPAAWRTAH